MTAGNSVFATFPTDCLEANVHVGQYDRPSFRGNSVAPAVDALAAALGVVAPRHFPEVRPRPALVAGGSRGAGRQFRLLQLSGAGTGSQGMDLFHFNFFKLLPRGSVMNDDELMINDYAVSWSRRILSIR